MALLSLEDLTRPLTTDEVKVKIYEVFGLVGASTSSWKPGAVMRTMIAATSIILAAFSVLVAQIARAGFLELAERAWLDLVAWHVYGVRRELASYAEGEITLINSGGGLYALDPEDLIVAHVDTGKQYRNTAPISIGPLQTVVVPVRAVEAGEASTAAPGKVTELVTPLLGIASSNDQPLVGLDEEGDPALRARCSEKLGSLSPFGPWDAYTSAARNARRVDASRVGVTRVRTTKDGFGNVTVYVATASGAVTGDDEVPASDLGVVNEAIQRYAVPMPAAAHVQSAVEKALSVSYRLTMYNTSGLTQAQIVAAVEARLVAFFAAQPIGGNVAGDPPGKLYHDALRTAIGSTLPQIFHVDVEVPAGDVSLLISEVPVLGTVTATLITQVPPSEGAAA